MMKMFFKTSEAADYLGISKSTLYKHMSEGRISYFKPTGKIAYLSKEALDTFIQGNPQYSIGDMLNMERRNDYGKN